MMRWAVSACFLLTSCNGPNDKRPYEPQRIIDHDDNGLSPGFRSQLGWRVRDGRDPLVNERSYRAIRESQTTIILSERDQRIGLVIGCKVGKGWSVTLSLPIEHRVAVKDATLDPTVPATLTVYSDPPQEFHRWENVITIIGTQTLTAANSEVLSRKMAAADSMQFSFTSSGNARRAVTFELDGLATLLQSADSACGRNP